MPLYVFYTMVQKSQKWPKTHIKGGGGPALIMAGCYGCMFTYAVSSFFFTSHKQYLQFA